MMKIVIGGNVKKDCKLALVELVLENMGKFKPCKRI
jgi:hypothetical protein